MNLVVSLKISDSRRGVLGLDWHEHEEIVWGCVCVDAFAVAQDIWMVKVKKIGFLLVCSLY